MTTAKHRPRTKPPQERRDEIMAAAQNLFLTQGIANTSIDQIAQGAEVAKGTFYLYFTSKDDVRAALAARFEEEMLAKIDAAVAARQDGDWKGKLGAWATACARAHMEAQRLHDIVFHSAPAHKKDGIVDNPIVDNLAALIERGGAAKAWSVDDSRFTAQFLFSGVHGIAGGHGKKVQDSADQLSKLERMFWRGLGL